LLKRTRDPMRRAEREKELECPPFPLALEYIWRIFKRLARRRTSNGFGSNPITWSDIAAFEVHSKFPLKPWEIEIIEDLDDLDRAEQARSQSTNQNDGTSNA
jgi:hypothetical protein